MIRNLKAFGLALVAVFAMSAVAASVASAETTNPGLFTFGVGANELATIDDEQDPGTINTIALNGLSLTCGTVTTMGTPVKTKVASPDVVEADTKGPESTDITFEPIFGPTNCHAVVAGLTKTVTVTANGCGLIWDAKTTVTKTGFDNTAFTTVECPINKKIEIHVYNEKAVEATTLCTYDIEAIAANTTVPGITLTNKVNQPTSPNDITADINTELSINNTIKSALCGKMRPKNSSTMANSQFRRQTKRDSSSTSRPALEAFDSDLKSVAVKGGAAPWVSPGARCLVAQFAKDVLFTTQLAMP